MTCHSSLYITEDGEAVGTLRDFSSRFRLSPASVLHCLRRDAREPIILDAGEGRKRLLIVDANGLDALWSDSSRASSC